MYVVLEKYEKKTKYMICIPVRYKITNMFAHIHTRSCRISTKMRLRSVIR